MWRAFNARNASTVHLLPPLFLPREEGLLLLVTLGRKPGKERSASPAILILGSQLLIESRDSVLILSAVSSSEGELHLGGWWLSR